MTDVPTPINPALEAAVVEIEAHVARAGWDQRPALFGLVDSANFGHGSATSPDQAGLRLTPVEQEALPEAPLDDALAQIGWPAGVLGCALSQEILILPPSAEPALPAGDGALGVAASHPDRREARLVVAVLRDGSSAAVLRLRGPARPSAEPVGADGELLTGPDLAPNLAGALLATFAEN